MSSVSLDKSAVSSPGHAENSDHSSWSPKSDSPISRGSSSPLHSQMGGTEPGSPSPKSLYRRGYSSRLSPRSLASTTALVPVFIPPYRSTRLKEEPPKPWLDKTDRAMRQAVVLYWVIVLLSLAGSGISESLLNSHRISDLLVCYFGWRSVPRMNNL